MSLAYLGRRSNRPRPFPRLRPFRIRPRMDCQPVAQERHPFKGIKTEKVLKSPIARFYMTFGHIKMINHHSSKNPEKARNNTSHNRKLIFMNYNLLNRYLLIGFFVIFFMYRQMIILIGEKVKDVTS